MNEVKFSFPARAWPRPGVKNGETQVIQFYSRLKDVLANKLSASGILVAIINKYCNHFPSKKIIHRDSDRSTQKSLRRLGWYFSTSSPAALQA